MRKNIITYVHMMIELQPIELLTDIINGENTIVKNVLQNGVDENIHNRDYLLRVVPIVFSQSVRFVSCYLDIIFHLSIRV